MEDKYKYIVCPRMVHIDLILLSDLCVYAIDHLSRKVHLYLPFAFLKRDYCIINHKRIIPRVHPFFCTILNIYDIVTSLLEH